MTATSPELSDKIQLDDAGWRPQAYFHAHSVVRKVIVDTTAVVGRHSSIEKAGLELQKRDLVLNSLPVVVTRISTCISCRRHSHKHPRTSPNYPRFRLGLSILQTVTDKTYLTAPFLSTPPNPRDTGDMRMPKSCGNLKGLHCHPRTRLLLSRDPGGGRWPKTR